MALDVAHVKRLPVESAMGHVTAREIRFAKALDAVFTALDAAPDQTNLTGVKQLIREAIESTK
jgi:hypothetical protein